MAAQSRVIRFVGIIIGLLALLIVTAACNLTSAPEEQLALTEVASVTPQPTRTQPVTDTAPTTLPLLTPITLPTLRPGQLPPTTIALPPTFIPIPTSTPLPISIVILSPIPGNVIASNVQVLGAAVHPLFLQYQVEYGPDPNPGNLWYPATSIVGTPIVNGLLGVWNTTVIPDGIYQLRLRVFLRDGSSLTTVVNNIRVQNRVPTPVPSNTPTIPRPIAAFTQDRASGQAPLVVRFQNQSSGVITSYSWNFGDGGSSPEQNPVYTFRLPGVYNVTLTVTGPGGTSNVSRQITVQSQTPPVAAFTQDKISGPPPLTVRFTNQSTGNITSYAWNFGDGQTSTEPNPTHTFSAVGTYNVLLTVTGPGGTSSVVRKITVEDPVIPPPVAAFTPSQTTGNYPLQVQFINQSTGRIDSYNWDFGDGQSSTDLNPVHTFTSAGTFRVRLTAIGPGGQSSAEATIVVTQPPNVPKAAFTADVTSGNAPLTVNFTNQSTGDITAFAWDFGDGQSSNQQNPSHTYTSPGSYIVNLTVSGPGGSDSAQTIISVTTTVQPPRAAFTQDKTSGEAPLTVQFINQSEGENLTYQWDFGDGTTSTDNSPSHTFVAAGTYTVNLTVSNSAGRSQAQTTITVTEPVIIPPPVAAFTADPLAGDAPLTVQFTNQSTGDITAFAWDFGDGLGFSAEPNPSYTFNAPGVFTVALTVSGPGGASAPATTTITVTEPVIVPPPSLSETTVFASNRDGNDEIYLRQADGALRNLTNHPASDTAPAWSPDGSQIVFASDRDGSFDIFVMNSDGSGLVNLTNHPASDGNPAVQP